jgi:hypothetical protein
MLRLALGGSMRWDPRAAAAAKLDILGATWLEGTPGRHSMRKCHLHREAHLPNPLRLPPWRPLLVRGHRTRPPDTGVVVASACVVLLLPRAAAAYFGSRSSVTVRERESEIQRVTGWSDRPAVPQEKTRGVGERVNTLKYMLSLIVYVILGW